MIRILIPIGLLVRLSIPPIAIIDKRDIPVNPDKVKNKEVNFFITFTEELLHMFLQSKKANAIEPKKPALEII
ncbi:MAG: hypothetical protein JHC31_14915 [Sulfurihydrogenibium sp.]|uniref:hypothetical protein n=1 Tax=Sulfurihydrogenibium sp. (strain YO3AOP1) TaxID=436114 RepID=UPI00031BB727|nr:hypothetical protein [Sulfurihydrogenibium sp. YO3AOP1]MBX0313030.1 hypothetical protein [Sulfurihydrogenibium sp.]